MSHTTTRSRAASRASKPSTTDRRVRAGFARAAVFAEFGCHARSLDQADFEDRKPWQLLVPSPEARFAK